jgi:hypothetical protein
MGFLNFFSKPPPEPPQRLHSGSFSVDAEGHVVASTLPQSFPASHMRELSQLVLRAFLEARDADLALTELWLDYKALRVSAKEMRGGAMIFVSPRRLGQG